MSDRWAFSRGWLEAASQARRSFAPRTVHIEPLRAGAGEELAGPGDFRWGAVGDEQELVGFERGLVRQHGIPGNPQAVERRAQGAEPSDQYCPTHNVGNPAHQGTEYDHVSHYGTEEQC